MGGDPGGPYRVQRGRRHTIAAVVLGAVIICTAACGADANEGAEPPEWAASVCVRLNDWLADLRSRRDQLATEVAAAPNLADAKARLVAYFTDAAGTTDDLISGLRALEQPAVDEGEQLQVAFEQSVEQAVAAFEQARVSAEALGIDDPAAFATAAEGLFDQVAQAGPRVDAALRQVLADHDAPEVREAFTDAPACRDLASAATTTVPATTTTTVPSGDDPVLTPTTTVP